MHVHLDQAFGGISLRSKHQLSRQAGSEDLATIKVNTAG